MNGDVDGGKGFVRTGVNSVDILMHESTSREVIKWTGIPAQGDLLARLPRGSQWLFHLAANGLSFPLRLRGSGGFSPLFHTSIRFLKNNKPIEHKMSRVN
jgi:hypothetical protein